MYSKFIPVNARDERGDRDDRRPRRDLLDDEVLAHTLEREVRLQNAGQELALAHHYLVHPPPVDRDVPEEAPQPLVHLRERAALEVVERFQQWRHGAVELDHLPLEPVDALGRIGTVGEDLLLDLLDVGVEPLHHRFVVVDDLVEDRGARGPSMLSDPSYWRRPSR
jgi:hypothetical protein